MNNPIELRNVVKIYNLGGGVKINALRGIDLTIKKGESISIMGPSGCGKTTLLNMIGGLDHPTDGQVIVDGIDITNMREKKLAQIRREKIGFIFQFYNLVPMLSALENVQLPMIFAGKLSVVEIRDKAMELLRLVGLERRMHHRPTQMSGGEQQRVTIARALANEPSIILADEPTGNVDQETGWKILRLIQNLNKILEQTYVIITHDPEIAKTSEKIFYMRDGQIYEAPPRSTTAPSQNILAKEQRQLMLAELRWLKTSLVSLEKKKAKLNPESYAQIKMSYAQQLERLERMIKEDQGKGRSI
ncbi:MAG: ABC transporter ATP-binding protein [Candidatus Methylarchaceae archaeon HK02M1]|nr:ABC transporter ATP-binding protein [Candidatus Methylarchaceae archaeon HK02M1]